MYIFFLISLSGQNKRFYLFGCYFAYSDVTLLPVFIIDNFVRSVVYCLMSNTVPLKDPSQSDPQQTLLYVWPDSRTHSLFIIQCIDAFRGFPSSILLRPYDKSLKLHKICPKSMKTPKSQAPTICVFWLWPWSTVPSCSSGVKVISIINGPCTCDISFVHSMCDRWECFK